MAGARSRPLSPEIAQRRASDPEASAWVGASAGTGKTKVLTDRVLRLMLSGTPPHRILCITFTKAAAAEMANRINARLATWATSDDAALEDDLAALTGARPSRDTVAMARRLFAHVLDAPGGLQMLTIHAFCQSLLRRFPIEAGLPPQFELIDDRTAAELLAAARARVLDTPSPSIAEALDRIAAHLGEEGFAELIATLVRDRSHLRAALHGHGGRPGLARAVRRHLGVPPGADRKSLLAAACRDDAFDGPGLRAAVTALSAGSESDRNRATAIAAWLDDPATRTDRYLRYRQAFLTEKRTVRARLATKAAVAAAAPGAVDALGSEAERLADLEGRLNAAVVAEATDALITVGSALLDAYAADKAHRALLDYEDLVLQAADLLQRPGIAPWVLYKLDGGIDHVLVDEAQDTSPVQWQVIAALTAEFFAGAGASDTSRTVFAVGDEKQSIFSFQGADPAEFDRLRRWFAGHAQAARLELRSVDLDISFRSAPAILDFVDTVFADPQVRDGVIADAGTAIRHRPFRRGQGGLVEVWPPLGPVDDADQAPWTPPVEQARVAAPTTRLAATVAGTIAGWLARGEELVARGRPIEPGDILVLVRTRAVFFTELVRALKDRGVPVAGVDRMVLTDQLAVMDLVALGNFLLMPEDDLTLATVLKGPLVGADDDHLFAVAHGRPGTLWHALGAADAPWCRAARRYLGDLLARVDFAAPHELFTGVLVSPCPADGVSGRRAVLKRLGPEADDALDEFLALALTFEDGQPPSLQRFLHWLAAGRVEVKRELDTGDRGQVRIMTVHGAKGLQAPIVFLADSCAKPKQGDPVLWPDRPGGVPLWPPRRSLEDPVSAAARGRAERRRNEEYRRLLYVALTRAEDRLYVCGYHGKRAPEPDCWHALCAAAMDRVDGVSGVAVPAAPGLPTLEALRHSAPQTAPVAAAGSAPQPVETPPLAAWARRPVPPEPEPARPLTPSKPPAEEPPVRSPLGSDDGARFRRGRLIHRLLEILPQVAPAVRPAAARQFLSRPAYRLTPEERSAYADEVMAILDHPDFAPLFGPDSQAEVPIVGEIGGFVLSGQIDRLVVTADRVLVVDYKTNRPPPKDAFDISFSYLRQMAIYREALRKTYSNLTVQCALLWTDGPRMMPLPNALLDRWAP